jgi:signal peptidase I
MGTTYASGVIDEQDSKPRTSFWRELPILLAVAVVVAVVVRAFVLQTFYIPSPSMEHTLNINDRVLVNKLVYDFRDPHRGEIVVFEAPMDWRTDPSERDFIKRVIGVGGDHVKCCDDDGHLQVNGVSLDEPYLYTDDPEDPGPASDDTFDITVPKGRLWVMGDHREMSGDSREQFQRTGDTTRSTIPVGSVVGRAFVLFWPFSRVDWLTVPSGYDKIPANER